MRPPFVHSVQAELDGVRYVGDGALLLRADLVEPSPAPEGAREVSGPSVAPLLSRTGAHAWRLDQLVPSRLLPGGHRTPDDVAITGAHLELLRALGGAIELVTDGPASTVVLREQGKVLGALIPPRVPPELGGHLPAPSAGASRARVTSFVPAQGFAMAALEDGREVILDVASISGMLLKNLAPHALVDLDPHLGRDGRLRAQRVWIAGTPRPATP